MSHFKVHKKNRIKNIYVTLLLFALIISLFLLGVSYVNRSTGNRQEAALTRAVERNIVHCYAMEGFYPPSLEYMENNYGLTYDKKMFLVDYRPIGTNIYPDFTIIRKGGSK